MKPLLFSVLSLPTTSFNEDAVSAFVELYAAGLGLRVKKDRAGNLLVSTGKPARGPRIIFAAHMDHPGFEVIKSSGKKGIVVLWGRVDAKICKKARIRLYTGEGTARGVIVSGPLKKKYMNRNCFRVKCSGKIGVGDFGHFDLKPVRERKGIIHARAADDLANVAAILELFTRLPKRVASNVVGLFTRAEESGLLGAVAASEGSLFKKGDILISLECSSKAGGNVDIGFGPVIRAGDARGTYDPSVEAWMSRAAQDIKEENKAFKSQRSLLAGGTCEAYVYTLYGQRSGGIALALGNYHNHGDGRPKEEYISYEDYKNLVLLLEKLSTTKFSNRILKDAAIPLKKNYKLLRRKLLSSR
jgi:putative aminopeptidase FrvX